MYATFSSVNGAAQSHTGEDANGPTKKQERQTSQLLQETSNMVDGVSVGWLQAGFARIQGFVSESMPSMSRYESSENIF